MAEIDRMRGSSIRADLRRNPKSLPFGGVQNPDVLFVCGVIQGSQHRAGAWEHFRVKEIFSVLDFPFSCCQVAQFLAVALTAQQIMKRETKRSSLDETCLRHLPPTSMTLTWIRNQRWMKTKTYMFIFQLSLSSVFKCP